MDLGLSARVAIVAGASRGLGRASAEALAGEGVAVVLAARGETALREVADGIVAEGGTAVVKVCDVTEDGVPQLLVDEAIERFGQLDIVVANSGGPPSGHALDVDDEALRTAIDANLLTHVRFVRAALPSMAARHWGRICCIASYSIVQPIPTLALSNSARSALWAWAKTAAFDLQDSGVTINLACPGLHRTDRILALGPMPGPVGDPADFGRVVAFLCSEPAAFVSGAAIIVDGGATLAL